jgi:hypothetical protein
MLTDKWLRRFITSHIFGWVATLIQTGFIIYEVRKVQKQISKKSREHSYTPSLKK